MKTKLRYPTALFVVILVVALCQGQPLWPSILTNALIGTTLFIVIDVACDIISKRD